MSPTPAIQIFFQEMADNPLAKLAGSWLSKRAFDWVWNTTKTRVNQKDPFEQAIEKFTTKTQRHVLGQDLRRWFREQHESGLFEQLARGEDVDGEVVLSGFARALAIHVNPQDAAPLFKQFLEIFVGCLYESPDAEEIHRFRSENADQQMGSSLQTLLADSASTKADVAYIKAAVTAKQSGPASIPTDKWGRKNETARELLDQGANESALVLCELALAESDIAQAPAETIAKIENNMGCCLVRMGRMPDAIMHFERACTLNPAEDKYRNNYLAIRSNTQPADSALLKQIEMQLGKTGPNSQLQAAKGQVLAALHGPAEALRWISQCTQTVPLEPEILCAAAMLALRIPDYEKARAFVDQGLTLIADDPHLIRLKADILMLRHMQERTGVMFPPLHLSAAQTKDIQDSVALYTQAITQLSSPPAQRKFLRSEVLTQRGVARMSLGDTDGALADFNAAIQDNPNDTTARFNRITISIRFDRELAIREDATYLLVHAVDRSNVLRNYCAYLGEKGHTQELQELARRYPAEVESSFETGFIIALSQDANRRPYKCSRAYLKKWRKTRPATARWQQAFAHVLCNMGHLCVAERLLLRTLDESGLTIDLATASQNLAALYAKQQRWPEACAAFRRYVPLTAYTPDLPEYLFSVMRAEGVASALKVITDQLPPSVRQHPRIAFLWAQMEETTGQVAKAARLYLRAWRANGNSECAVRCAQCLYRRPQTRSRARVILLRVERYEEVRPEIAMFAAAMLADLGYHEKALDVGYRVAARNPTNRFVEERYAGLLLVQFHEKFNLQPTRCDKDHVVDVVINNESRSWHLDPPPADPRLQNCEVIHEQNVLAAILGKSVSETFSFTGRGPGDIHQGTIKQIRRKELKLLHEILDHVRIRPQENATLWAIKADVNAMRKELGQHTTDRVKIVSTYRNNRFPAAWLANAIDRSVIETYWILLQGELPPLSVFPGDPHEMAIQDGLAASDSPFILDLQALQLAQHFGLLSLVKAIAPRCLVTQASIDAVTNATQSARMAFHSEMSITSDPLGGLQVHRTPEADKLAYKAHLAAIDAFVKELSHKQILGAPTTRELPPEAVTMLGQEVADLIELSRELRLPVLLGDWTLTGLLRPRPVFSLRAVINTAQRQSRIQLEEVAKVLATMKASGFQYISVSEELLMAASEILLVHQDAKSYAALFAQLSPENSNPQTAMPILAKCVKHFSIKKHLSDTHRQQLVLATLTAVFGKKRHARFLRELRERLKTELQLAPAHLNNTLQSIDLWEKTLTRMST